jgi:tetratricopeptide (TPR) repeat protein
VPPTDPLPFVPPPLPGAIQSDEAGVSTIDARSGTVGAGRAAAASPLPRSHRMRRVLAAVAAMLSLYLATSEAVAWIGAERLRGVVSTIDGPALAAAEESYERVASTGPLDLGLRMRVDGRLQSHLVGLANRVVEDYRHEQPSLTLSDWKQAQQALRWSLRLAPGDRMAQAKLQTCDAHILRISTKSGRSDATQATFRRAIDRFREAARLDPESYDPYLGITRIAVYNLVPADVELASQAMEAAEKRGYSPGRRERALLGDGHMRRGEVLRHEARHVSGAERMHALEQARQSFRACIEAFEPILGFANAARNIETCKTQAALVDEEIEDAQANESES